MVAMSLSDVRAVLGQDVELAPDLVDAAGRVPAVGPQRHDAQRLARTGAADQDRQPALDGARFAQRIMECVEPALVA